MTWVKAHLDPMTLAQVTTALAAHDVTVRPSPDPREPPALVVCDLGNLDTARDALGAAGNTPPLIVLAQSLTRGALTDLLEIPQLTGLVALNSTNVMTTLERHLRELTSPFMHTGPAPTLTAVIRSSAERDAILVQIEATLAAAGVRARVMGRAVSALEELITNALYDAPTDTSGRPLHLTTDRRTVVAMPPDAYPTLTVAVAEGQIHAAMTDPFGSLSATSFRSYLARGLRGDFADKAGGAGLGFARIYAAVDDLHIRVIPGRSTRVAVSLDVTAPRREPGARPNGLFILERA